MDMCPIHKKYKSAFTDCPECRNASQSVEGGDALKPVGWWRSLAVHLNSRNLHQNAQIDRLNQAIVYLQIIAAVGWIGFVGVLIFTGPYFQ